VKASPREPEAHFGLGYLYWKEKRYEDARSAFQGELSQQPQHTQALTYLADTEMHMGDEKGAEEHLRQALQLDANIRLAHLDLGTLLASRNDSDSAVAHFREAIRIDSSKPDAHYRLGRLLLSLGRQKEAEAEFAHYDPPHVGALGLDLALCSCWFWLGPPPARTRRCPFTSRTGRSISAWRVLRLPSVMPRKPCRGA